MFDVRLVLEHPTSDFVQGALIVTYVVTPTHINLIRPGDTIEVDGHLKTVSPGAIGKGFMGKTLWGDSYRLGTLLVRRVILKTACMGKI